MLGTQMSPTTVNFNFEIRVFFNIESNQNHKPDISLPMLSKNYKEGSLNS